MSPLLRLNAALKLQVVLFSRHLDSAWRCSQWHTFVSRVSTSIRQTVGELKALRVVSEKHFKVWVILISLFIQSLLGLKSLPLSAIVLLMHELASTQSLL